MTENVIYSYFPDVAGEKIIESLYNKFEWNPSFIIESNNLTKDFKTKFDDVDHESSINIRRMNLDYKKIGPIKNIDSSILRNLSKFESTYYNWLEETNKFQFSINQRTKYFHEILTFWNTIIKNKKISLFVSYTWPHVPSDYLLYLLCKYHYNIPVLFFDNTPLLNSNRYCINTSLENQSEPFLDFYSKKNLSISDETLSYIKSVKKNNAKKPNHIIKYENILNSEYKNFSFIKNVLKLFFSRKLLNNSGYAFKKNKYFNKKSFILNNLEYLLFKNKVILNNVRNEKYYLKKCNEIKQNENYILFPAPYQPEANSNLAVGVYENISLMLKMIIETKPKNWKVYYKEHPCTFLPTSKGSLARNIEFYDEISKIDDLVFISHRKNTFELIDNSKVVCTAGGTAGWEALLRNIPAIIFGSLWYQSCKSLFKIDSIKDLKLAFEKIESGYTPDQDDIKKFTESCFRSSYNSLIRINDRHNFIKKSNNKLIEHHANCFYNEYLRSILKQNDYIDPYKLNYNNGKNKY